jgi:hypothetical protein
MTKSLPQSSRFGLCQLSNILKNHHEVSEADSVSICTQKSTSAGGPPKSSYSQSLGTTETVNLLRYAPDKRSSPRVVAGKWLLKN